MTARDIVAGINLLLPYYNDPEGQHISAEHDELWLDATDRALTPEDVEKMVALGWHQVSDDDDGDDDADEEFAPKHYRPEEAWIAYV
jgi:hypothetical protein